MKQNIDSKDAGFARYDEYRIRGMRLCLLEFQIMYALIDSEECI